MKANRKILITIADVYRDFTQSIILSVLLNTC